MDSSFIAVFSSICIFISIFDFYYCYKIFQKDDRTGKWLALSAAAAGIITLSYLYSILTYDYQQASIASSIYFLTIDWMLIFLVHFTYLFTELEGIRGAPLIRRIICAYAVFDTLVFLINIFQEIAVRYVRRDTVIAHFAYQMKPLYVMHLIFSYFLVVLTLCILIRKSMRTPRQYRNQYILNILAIAMVVAVNALFLYPKSEKSYTLVDYSIIGYSVALYLMYWAAFEYRHKDMLESLSMTIFENIGQGIVLFDYSGRLVMHNQKADRLLAGLRFEEKMPVREFEELCQIPEELRDKDQYSIQCQLAGGKPQPVQCNYRVLRDNRGGEIGSLFVLADVSNEIDLLTGFQHWENFRRFALENPYHFVHPTAVVILDIVGLGHINRTFGRDVGDQRIRNLVRVMRRFLPADAYFVRGYEAHLVAVCPGRSEADIRGCVEDILDTCGDSVLFSMNATTDRAARAEALEHGSAASTVFEPENYDVIAAIDTASRTLQIKKLLSTKSQHSQALSSLVRALMESDSDTEAHVQRTQKMGEALGRRIGLNDAQLAELKLLCLLHDIGKIGIPLEILNKPGKLTDAEWIVMRTHSEKGYQIAMSSEELRGIAPMILSHHERWDGKGYPEKLAGQNIPVLSRVISVVDAYDAMVNNRAYRKGLPPEAAQEEIRVNAGTQFDPFLAREFLQMLEENPEIARGENIGGEEVRAYIQTVAQSEDTGNTTVVPSGRYMLDLDEIIVEADDMFEEITGYPRSEAIGRLSQYDLIPDEDRAYYMVQVNNQFAKGSFAYLRHNIQRRDGEIVQVICYGKRYYDSAVKAFRSEILIFPVRDLLNPDAGPA